MANLFRITFFGLILFLAMPGLAPAQDEQQDETPEIEDVIVVTASRTEQRLQEVPVAMTVITSEQLETAPADDYGDILRNVPGLNVAQISARDIQIVGRGATGSLATDNLVLLDGRSVYLDFFGFVMWDLLPVDFREIAQVEVVRGPGSAVWGANAIGGVVNLITKSPWELVGTSVTLGLGEFDTLYGSVTHAVAGADWGAKFSAAYYEQDAYDRPTGTIPGNTTQYPDFQNSGTEQPKFDFRYDRNFGGDKLWSISGGQAATDGIVHSGIGPFDIDSGSALSYFKTTWSKGTFNVNFFANLLDGDATNLLTVGSNGLPLTFQFISDTYNLDFSNSHEVGRNTITYGATARHTDFDLSIAAGEDERDEVGVFLQDQIELTDKVTWLVGARWDDIDPIGTVVSPRTSLLFAPTPDHQFRMSYNKAFRAPSLIENYLGTAIVNLVDLGPALAPLFGPGLSIPYVFPTVTVGNPLLQEEALTAYEIGYVGTIANKTTITFSIYRNELEDATDFFQAGSYSSTNRPANWPPAGLLTLAGAVLPPGAPTFLFTDPILDAANLPSLFSYRNVGERINKGVEFSLDYRPNLTWLFKFNYSYQEEPEVSGIGPDEFNIPPANRLNLGLSYNGPKWFFDSSVNYVDEAYWTDVLDSRFWGTTEDYTMANFSIGVHLADDKVTLSLIGNNVFDEDIQQHIFGDIIARKFTAQARFTF